jgi:glycerol-3-phosphate acyltransferase PlsX
MVTVAVDAGGADLGPAEVAAGAARAAAQGISVLLFGPAREMGPAADGVEVIDAPISIAKAADPAFAVRSTPEASIVQAARAVAQGRAQALVSGGSTGSALAAGLFNMRRDRGIYRPALALPVPMPGAAPVLLLDVGANVTCRPEHLVQFAHMGSAFAQAVMGIDSPRVALLSNGEEPAKGTPDLVFVHEQLAAGGGTGLNFVGNVEGTQVTDGAADVVVMDGFTGNITLKLIEGVSGRTLRAIRDAAMSSPRARLGGLLLGPAVRRLRDEIDPEGQGGAYMLGLRQLGVVAHGRFTRRGFARAIEVAARGVDEDVIRATRSALQAAGALRPPRQGSGDDGGDSGDDGGDSGDGGGDSGDGGGDPGDARGDGGDHGDARGDSAGGRASSEPTATVSGR